MIKLDNFLFDINRKFSNLEKIDIFSNSSIILFWCAFLRWSYGCGDAKLYFVHFSGCEETAADEINLGRAIHQIGIHPVHVLPLGKIPGEIESSVVFASNHLDLSSSRRVQQVHWFRALVGDQQIWLLIANFLLPAVHDKVTIAIGFITIQFIISIDYNNGYIL